MTMRRDVHDVLRARLHEAAEAHEPDRDLMLARIERGMAGEDPDRGAHRVPRQAAWGWARIVGATAAGASMLAVGGYAVASVVKDDSPTPQTVAVSSAPVESPSATGSSPPTPHPSPTRRGGESREPAAPSTSPSPTATLKSETTSSAPSVGLLPEADENENGPLWSDGSVDSHSNDYWAQSNITIKTSEQLSSLTVQLKVAQTGGVTTTGAWRTLPEDDFTLTTVERDGYLVYTWALKSGRTVAAGEWVFAGQYDHAIGGRDAKDDRYTVVGTADGGQTTVGGDFGVHEGTG